MLNEKERAFVEENLGRLSVEEIARKLGLKPKKLNKEIRALGLRHRSQGPARPARPAYIPFSLGRTRRKAMLALALAVFAITFLAYANALMNDFIWDDEYLILNNSQIKSLSHVIDVFRTYIGFGSENVNNFYRPLQELSNMTDYALWGKNPFGFHLTSITLHALVAVLVCALIYYLCGNEILAAFAGACYGVHPVHSEAVTYIAGKADPLYALFFLSSFILFIRYANRVVKGKRGIGLYALSVGLFLPALLSKELSLILPVLIMLYLRVILKDAVPDKIYRNLKHLWIPYVAVILIYAFLRSQALRFSPAASPSLFAAIPLPFRLLTFFKTFIIYLGLLIFPVDLHMERTIGVTTSLFEADTLACAAIVIGVCTCAVIYARKKKLFSFFVFWFFINLLPVSNIYPINSFIAEHWIYIASIGYFFALSAFLCRLGARTRYGIPGKPLAIVLALLTLAAFSYCTIRRNADWKDEITFYENTLKYSPNNARLHLNFGNTYIEKGLDDKAEEEYKKAIAINKNHAESYGNIAVIRIKKGDFVEAEKYLKKAIEAKFKFPYAHANLGLVYIASGRIDEAIKELEISLKQLPQNTGALNQLGEIYLRRGNTAKARELFQKSLAIIPGQKDIEGLLASTGR